MTTITLDNQTKAGKTLLELAKKLALKNKDIIIENEILTKSIEEKTIKTISREVNKNITKKLFALHDIDYDSYNRQ